MNVVPTPRGLVPHRSGDRPPRRAGIPSLALLSVLLLLAGLATDAGGQALAQEARESPRELLKRAEALVASDPDAAIDLARKAADAAKASRNDIEARVQELNARWYLTQLLRFSVLGGRTDSWRASLYRDQVTRLDELLPAQEPRTEIELLRAELALVLGDPTEAIAHARAAALSASADQERLESPDASRPFGVTGRTVALLVGIALARKDLRADEPLVVLADALRGPIHPRFQNWIPEGQTQLIVGYVVRGQYDQAERLLEAFAPPSHSASHRASILVQMAEFALLSGHPDRATRFVDEAAALLPAEPDPFARGRVLSVLVATLLRLDRVPEAEETFALAADLLASDPDGLRHLLKAVETWILPVIEQSELAASGVRVYEKLLGVPSLAGDPTVALPLYATLARFYARTLQVQAFFDLWQKAEAAHRAAPNWEALQDLYLSGARLLSAGDPRRAANLYRVAIRIGYTQSFSGPRLLFRALRQAVSLAMEIGRYQDAVDFVLVGRGLALGTKATNDIVEFLVDAGEAMTELGRFDLGWDAFLVAGELAKRSAVDWEFQIQLGLSRLSARAGDTLGSMRILTRYPGRGLSTVGWARTRRRFPEELLLTGELWTRWGNHLRAEQSYQRCIDWVTRVVRRRDIELRCRAGLISLFRARGDASAADEQLRQALDVALHSARFMWTPPHYSYETSMLTFSLLLPSLKGDPGWVESQVDHFLTTTRAAPDTAPILARRAAYKALKLLAARQRSSAAPDLSPLRATLAKLFAEPYLSWRELHWLLFVGGALADLGERDLALETFSELAERFEAMRDALTIGQEPILNVRLAFGDQIDSVFESIVRLHLEAPNGVMAALAAHEANRARAAGDLRRLAAARAPQEETGDGLERARLRLARAITEWSGDPVRPALEFLQLLLGGLNEGASDQPAAETIQAAPPQRQSLARIPLSELQSRLDTATAIVVFRVTERASGAWVISRDSVVWRPLKPLHELEPAISRFRWALQSPEDADDARVKAIAKEAYLALIGPIASDLGQKERIVVIPDGPLFGVPFEALVIPSGPDAGSFFIEKYLVSYQLSLGLLQQSSAPAGERRSRRLLLVGDPEWPDGGSPDPDGSRDRLSGLVAARREIDDIKQVFGEDRTVVYMGEASRRDVLLGNLEEFTAVHLATHGVVKEHYPWDSYLAFSGRDSSLTLWDLAKMRLSADLVVLSACETARGRLLAGEGAWGFVAQFLGSGARNVVASLWRVDDHSTANLMQEFYRAMAPGFGDYGNALRTAKLRLLKGERWKHPYFWAPFVLYGGLP